MKICRTATVPFMLQNHLHVQIEATVAAGHSVTLICSDGPEIAMLRQIPGVKIILIDIPRIISPLRDILALVRLIAVFAREDFDVVHSTTPKGGLLSMIAAWVVRVPKRFHTFTGQPWAELRGFKRQVVKTADKLTARMSSLTFADSHSQAEFLIEEGVVPQAKIKTLGTGSLAGIDCRRFSPGKWTNKLTDIRRSLNVSENAKVIVFVGRITRDKGVAELVNAFEALQARNIANTLLLVGPFESDLDPLPASTMRAIHENSGIRCVGYTAEPEKYLAIAHLLCLPSYREGFGTVILEAAAMCLPAVGSDIVGVRDAIVDGETGILVPVKNAGALADALEQLLNNEELRLNLGQAAQRRVVNEFDCDRVNSLVIDEYAAGLTGSFATKDSERRGHRC